MKELMLTLILPAFMFGPATGFAGSEKQIVERYRSRYEDFFQRNQREARREQIRMSGRAEVKEDRLEKKELLERARKRYVANRKPPADDTAAYQRHLEIEAAQKRAQLKVQEEYALKQRRVEEITKGAIKIPPVLEYQLQDAL